VIGSDVAAMAPPTGVFLVARTVDGVVAGCGGVQSHVGDTAEIKRMWIDPASRGRGVGRRLLGELEAHSRDLGYVRVVLDTNATLVQAIAMYESAGYRPTERYNDNPYAQRWFVKELTP
jgi:ribosomal protein S18 acetylase RimI-like enzyme